MNITNPSILPGFMELLPKDQELFDSVKEIIEENFKKYGYINIDTPLIEKEEILLSKGGGETSKQIYRIDKEKNPQALRFDLTVSLARYVSMYSQNLNFPFRRYQIGKVYRGERNQKGRYREFYQCDIDIIGNENLDLINDAEIVSVMYNIFNDLGLKNIVFKISNRKLLQGFLESIEINKTEEIFRIIDKFEKIGKENIISEFKKIELEDKKIKEILEFIDNFSKNEDILDLLKSKKINNELYSLGVYELETVYNYMKKFGVSDDSIQIDLKIIRGLDYYTSTVYETFLKGHESIGSICSGGRYDNLTNNFSKKKYPGVGLSIGLTRLFYYLKEQNLLNLLPKEDIVLIIPMDKKTLDYSITIVNELRKNNIRSQIYLEDTKVKKKFSYANNIGVKQAIIIGESELNENTITLKDFIIGEQKIINKDKIIDYIGGKNENYISR